MSLIVSDRETKKSKVNKMITKILKDFKDLKRSHYFMIKDNETDFQKIKFISIVEGTVNKLAYFETPTNCIKLSIEDFNMFCYENKFEVARVIKDALTTQLKYIESIIKNEEYNVSHLN